MMDKKALRRLCLERRNAVGEKVGALSLEICKRCVGLRCFMEADTVLLYFAKGSEADLSLVAKEALRMGKTVGYPRCAEKGKMVFHKVADLSELERGSYGIMEPSEYAPLCRWERAVCLVPGLAFDEDGYRLGYGGGYYDRFLSDFSGVSIGAAYEECVLPHIIREDHDIKTDYIITESRVKRTIEN